MNFLLLEWAEGAAPVRWPFSLKIKPRNINSSLICKDKFRSFDCFDGKERFAQGCMNLPRCQRRSVHEITQPRAPF